MDTILSRNARARGIIKVYHIHIVFFVRNNVTVFVIQIYNNFTSDSALIYWLFMMFDWLFIRLVRYWLFRGVECKLMDSFVSFEILSNSLDSCSIIVCSFSSSFSDSTAFDSVKSKRPSIILF